MAKTEPATTADPVTESVNPLAAKGAAIDQAIDAWLVDVANDGTGHLLRLASNQADRLKVAIHTIIEEI